MPTAKAKTKPATAKRKTKPAKPTKAKAKAKAKPIKVPVMALRLLELGLELEETVAEQCTALVDTLGDLAAEQRATAAATTLARTRKGTSVARAYLTVIADGSPAAADAIVRYCATTDRDRAAMYDAFVAVWPTSTDAAALEAASVSFGKAIVGDPALLAASVEAARRLGNASALAERTATLERATRLAPLVKALSEGRTPASVTKQLAAAPADDRRHVYARVIADQNGFDAEVTVAAILTLADDATITDMSARDRGRRDGAWSPGGGRGSVEDACRGGR